MALPENREAVQEILEILEPLVLGRESKGFSCGCGAIHCGAAKADEIEPAGDTYPGQETQWVVWSVHMKANDPSESSWSCGLSEFVDPHVLDAMFKHYFGDQPDTDRPYRLGVSGADRVHAHLPAAVRIQENDSQIRFSFDWGQEQETARQVVEIYNRNPRRMLAGTAPFARIVSLLEAITPEVYRGGPDPELPYESKWLLDYRVALNQAVAVANHIFIQNMSETFDKRGEANAQADIAFSKIAAK